MRIICLMITLCWRAVAAAEASISDLNSIFGKEVAIELLVGDMVVQQRRSEIYGFKSVGCWVSCVSSMLGKRRIPFYIFNSGVSFKLNRKIGTLIFDGPSRPFMGYIVVSDQSMATTGTVLPFDRVYGVKLFDVESRDGNGFFRTMLVKVAARADVELMIKSAVRRGYAMERQGVNGSYYILSDGSSELVVSVINERPGFSMLINMRSGQK